MKPAQLEACKCVSNVTPHLLFIYLCTIYTFFMKRFVISRWRQVVAKEKYMTWREIKAAVETAGVNENEEILFIECELHDGDKTLYAARSGKALRLREHIDEAKAEANGCAT
jgi:arginyl-tRNA synthetase